MAAVAAAAAGAKAGGSGSNQAAAVLSGELSGLTLTPEASGISSCRSFTTDVTAAAAATPKVLLPDPYMQLQHVNGFTGAHCLCGSPTT
jgi:hypothetical protein